MLHWYVTLSRRASVLAAAFVCIAVVAASLPAAAEPKGEAEPVRMKVLLGVIGPLDEDVPAQLAKAIEAQFPSGHGVAGVDIEIVTIVKDMRELARKHKKVPPAAVIMAVENRSRELMQEKNAAAMIRVFGKPQGGIRLVFTPEQKLLATYLDLPADFKPDDAAFVTATLVFKASTRSNEPGRFIGEELPKAVAGMRHALDGRWDALPHRLQAPARYTFGNLAFIASQFMNDTVLHEEAVASLQTALKGWTREKEPREWAQAQTALGVALASLQERKPGGSYYKEAVAALRASQQIFTRKRHPEQWATAEANIGHTLRDRAVHTDDPAMMREAAAALRAGLDGLPDQSTARLAALNGLGAALLFVGVSEYEPTLLKEAEAAYRQALEALNAGASPAKRGDLQRSLALVLTNMGGRNEEALELYRESLAVFPRKDEPVIWGIVRIEMANVLSNMAEEESSAKRYREAIAAYRDGLALITSEHQLEDWFGGTINLGATLHLLGRQEKDVALMAEAVKAYEAAGKFKTREQDAFNWALVRANLGEAWADIGVLNGDTAQIARGIAALREALQVWTRKGDPAPWADATALLAKFLIRHAEHSGDNAQTTEAISLLKEVIAYREKQGEADAVKKMQMLLKEAGVD